MIIILIGLPDAFCKNTGHFDLSTVPDLRCRISQAAQSAVVLFEVTTNYLFTKYRLQALIFKIPAFHRPLLN